MVHHLQVQVQVKVGAAVPLFMGRGNWSLSNTTSPGAWAEAYLRTKRHLDTSSRLATIDMGQKLDGLRPLFGKGKFGPCTKSPGPRPTSIPSGILIHPAIWPTTDMGRKMGGQYPFGGSSPSNTMWSGPRPTFLTIYLQPANHLATVHQRHRQDRQNSHPKTVCPMLSDRCLSCLSVLWPNGWVDQDKTWHAA